MITSVLVNGGPGSAAVETLLQPLGCGKLDPKTLITYIRARCCVVHMHNYHKGPHKNHSRLIKSSTEMKRINTASENATFP
ncbi:hypothetical protein CANTEDRAFT_113418 [Yamadazyma tenuis ATCC 10573]|uniref:Uncharacterized protein n=1 Tax=Candida tenuis (strain ATCC 10573 / BCRC 21748 / CBS 615 / JCM 9827 / NBRC 10315 / NRRL Y-1498 / VKM Y-70) TaxID=590646 RepID=G3B2B5_CANTC|nr:uncharacterized protein CANTEDRAFT_113418 [Yamadazyma tenuis ATCC 10573]EGV64637.1 hypothetical protein CANTEDRAFT_113418 [Yamadazyma tenuis ATCC 10573]